MTTETVRDIIAGQFPDRAVCVGKNSWYHGNGGRSFQFNITLLPGLDGSTCQLWQGSTLEEALAKFEADRQTAAQPSTVEVE